MPDDKGKIDFRSEGTARPFQTLHTANRLPTFRCDNGPFQ